MQQTQFTTGNHRSSCVYDGQDQRISLLSIIFSWEVKNITECWQDCSENKKSVENDEYYV